MASVLALPAPPARLSAKLRRAIELRVRKGVPISDACKEAGLSTAGWFKAMKRATVRNHLEEVQRRFIAEADTTRAVLRVRALEVAADMLETATSETVKVRLIEFLVGDGKAPSVAVHVDARAMTPLVGYAYPWQASCDSACTAGPELIESEPQDSDPSGEDRRAWRP